MRERLRAGSRVRLIPASSFTVEALVSLYNQGRIDYTVPMPMTATDLGEYVRIYEVDLKRSVVAMMDGEPAGLNMLGVRPDHTWITRLEVIPDKRGCGLGQRMMEYLIERSRELAVSTITLEVIKHNEPAYRLFRKLGFRETRELLVLQRPPSPPTHAAPDYAVQHLDQKQAMTRLRCRRSVPSWLDELPSLRNAGGLSALQVELNHGDWGWLTYQKTPEQLSRLVLQAEVGDPHRVGLALTHALYARFPNTETKSENLPITDPHWPAMRESGFVEAFRRIEMQRDMNEDPR